jgi:hypothetical protein
MRVALGGVERRGRALDLRDAAIAGEAAVAAVRDPSDDRIDCPPPQAVHERVGLLHRDVSISVVAAVADAARTRGASTEYDGELRAVEADLAAIDVPDVDLEAARERVAAAAADVDRLNERVARTSGRVEARREAATDPAEAEAALQTATRELADAETDYHAAREALAAAREQARDARDARQRRLELQDRRENLRRAARRALADEYADAFRRAVRALPVTGEPAHPRTFAGSDWAAACAVARLARPGAPLVVADGFECATRARAALGAPVLLAEL